MDIRRSAAAAGHFVRARLRGEVPIGRVFWIEMLGYGTAINVVTTIAALLLFANDFPAALGAAVYFAPLPFNLFLLIAVWRSAANAPEPRATAARAFALLWFFLAVMA